MCIVNSSVDPSNSEESCSHVVSITVQDLIKKCHEGRILWMKSLTEKTFYYKCNQHWDKKVDLIDKPLQSHRELNH